MDLLRGRKLGRIVSRRRSFSSETTDLDGFVYPLGFVRWSNVNRNGGGGREEVVTNDSFARIRAVTVKTTRSITCFRRTPEGETRDEGTHEVEGGNIIQRLGSRFSIGSLYLAKLLANYELRRARRMSHGCVARPVSLSLSLSFRRDRPRERRREKKETKEKEEVSPREIGYAATGK